MKRHFSNRGEALPEVTAARVLAHRKGSVKTSFVTQVDLGPAFHSGPRSEKKSHIHLKGGNRDRKRMSRFVVSRSKGGHYAIDYQEAFQNHQGQSTAHCPKGAQNQCRRCYPPDGR